MTIKQLLILASIGAIITLLTVIIFYSPSKKKREKRQKRMADILEELRERSYDHTIERGDWTMTGTFRVLFDEYRTLGGTERSFYQVLFPVLRGHLCALAAPEEKRDFLMRVTESFRGVTLPEKEISTLESELCS